MSYLIKLITPFLFIPLITNINTEDKYYKLLKFKLIEENEGIKIELLYDTKLYDNKTVNGILSIFNFSKEEIFIYYTITLNGERQEINPTRIIPYNDFIDEEGYIQNFTKIEFSSEQTENRKLKYYPNKKENSHFELKEENNNKYISTKYIHESIDLEDEEFNFSHYERFKFFNFYKYVYKEGYSFFDPTSIKFIYENGNDNNLICSPELYIFDTYNVFKRFSYLKDSMYKILPVSISNIDNTYYLSFKEGLYYDPITFDMSPYFIQGYEYDEVLYFPINMYDKLKDLKLKLKLNIVGYMDIDISGEFELGFNKRIYGDCDSSLYCTYIDETKIEGISEDIEIRI